MSKVPSLSYTEVIRALQRNSWVVVRQKGSPDFRNILPPKC
jgi:predicted RNA binding protein YcfA (HicA-like mRNA interferase family)